MRKRHNEDLARKQREKRLEAEQSRLLATRTQNGKEASKRLDAYVADAVHHLRSAKIRPLSVYWMQKYGIFAGPRMHRFKGWLLSGYLLTDEKRPRIGVGDAETGEGRLPKKFRGQIRAPEWFGSGLSYVESGLHSPKWALTSRDYGSLSCRTDWPNDSSFGHEPAEPFIQIGHYGAGGGFDSYLLPHYVPFYEWLVCEVSHLEVSS